eukprot:2164110-Alexandrium_andersonii.AAC.1
MPSRAVAYVRARVERRSLFGHSSGGQARSGRVRSPGALVSCPVGLALSHYMSLGWMQSNF